MTVWLRTNILKKNNDTFMNFTVGPVPMDQEILDIGSEQLPYFRTEYFSKIVLQCQQKLLDSVNAPLNSKVIFLVSSGTGGMEAVCLNLISIDDEPVIINGGGFGERFVNICTRQGKKVNEVKIPYGKRPDVSKIKITEKTKSFIVNGHETSTGVLYQLDEMAEYCLHNNLMYIVDAISLYTTDPIDMSALSIDALIIGSQKGIALPPGMTFIILSPKAIDHVRNRSRTTGSLYLDFNEYLDNIDRGQTPFTPSVGIILQLYSQLNKFEKNGMDFYHRKASNLASLFRNNISTFPLELFTKYMPNALTALTTTNGESASDLVNNFITRYKIYLNPNGSELSDKVFRVSHMGNQSEDDVRSLLSAFEDYYR